MRPSGWRNAALGALVSLGTGCAALRAPPLLEAAATKTAAGEAAVASFDLAPAAAHLNGSVRDEAKRARVAAAIATLAERQDEWRGWVLPLLARYLPANTVTPDWRVRFDLGLGAAVRVEPAATAVVVDLAADVWHDGAEAAADAVWNEMVRALYRYALLQALAPAPADGSPVLTALQREGLIDYVAAKGRPFGLDRADYRLAMQRDAVEARFAVLDAYTRARAGLLAPAGPRTWAALAAYDRTEKLFGVTGAYMAQVIEAQRGRSALVATIQQGPDGFYAAYTATRPGALVYFEAAPRPQGPEQRRLPAPAGVAPPLAEHCVGSCFKTRDRG